MRAAVRRTRRGGESGAGAVEYVGVIALVVALILSLVVAATPVGQAIAAKLCEAVGASCGAAQVPGAEPDAPPTEPCVVDSAGTNVDYSLSVAFVDVGSGVGLQTDHLSDGTYKSTLSITGQAGATLSSGELVGKLQIGDYGGGLEAEAAASAALRAGGGLEYTFSSAEEAADFEEWAVRTFAKESVKSATGPAIGIGVEFANWAINKVTGYDYVPPAPTGFYAEGGPVISGSAGAGVIVGGANASGEFSSALGYRQDFSTGGHTVYTRVKLDQEAAADLGLKQMVAGKASVEVVAEVSVDADGQLTGLALSGATTAEGSYDLSLLTGMPLQDAGGLGLGVRASLPVDDASRSRLSSALSDLGVYGATSPERTAAALSELFGVARENGEVTAQAMEVSSSNLLSGALGVKAPAIGGLEVGLKSGTNSSSTQAAWYLGEHGWNVWEACS